MAANLKRVVLDTNIFISDILNGGKPREVVELIYSEQIKGVISPAILTELQETLIKKFKFLKEAVLDIEKEIEESFELVYPKLTIAILEDNPDNRVLEAAIEGKCYFIVTGDNDLLRLKEYKRIKIITPHQFLYAIKI